MAIPQTSVAESMTAAFAGMVADSSPNKDVRSYVSEEASAEIPFGVMVGQGTLDDQCLLLAAITDKMIGVVVHSHAYAKDVELGTTGIKPKMTVGVMKKGVVWVYVEEAVTPASTVLCRAVAAGAEKAGAFRDTADASDLIDCSSFARFLSSTTGAGIALLEFDVAMRGADPID